MTHSLFWTPMETSPIATHAITIISEQLLHRFILYCGQIRIPSSGHQSLKGTKKADGIIIIMVVKLKPVGQLIII